jgi:hypothetical protein
VRRRTPAPGRARPDREVDGTTLKVVIASLIAFTSLLSAVGAWRAAEADDNAASQERKAFADVVAAGRERAQIAARIDEAVFDFIRSQVYARQAGVLAGRARSAARPDAARLRAEAAALNRVSRRIRDFVDRDAVTPDGEFVIDEKLKRDFDVAERRLDLDPKPELRQADDLSSKSEWLVLTTTVMIAAAFFFTLAQVSRKRARALYMSIGLIVLVAAAASLAMLEALR